MTFAVCLYFFTNFSFQIYFSTALNRHKNNNSATWQLAKIRLEWVSQSKGSISHPLGFVIDRLNTSALLYRIAPCLRPFRTALMSGTLAEAVADSLTAFPSLPALSFYIPPPITTLFYWKYLRNSGFEHTPGLVVSSGSKSSHSIARGNASSRISWCTYWLPSSSL